MKEINNNIQEINCSLKISELLKEKGFNVPCSAAYIKEFVRNGKTGGDIFTGNIKLVKNPSYFLKPRFVCYAPTHSIALEWIRVNFGIDIIADGVRYAGDEKASYYSAKVNGNSVLHKEKFDTPSEAIDAALLYTLLTKLIL